MRLPAFFMDMGLEPLFSGIRDQMPGTSYLALLYREAVCLDVWKGARRADMVHFRLDGSLSPSWRYAPLEGRLRLRVRRLWRDVADEVESRYAITSLTTPATFAPGRPVRQRPLPGNLGSNADRLQLADLSRSQMCAIREFLVYA
jgi:hypothetical protein